VPVTGDHFTGRTLGCNPPLLQDDNPVADPFYLLHVVGRDHRRGAFSVSVGKEAGPHFFRDIRVQADLDPVGNVRIGQENLRNALLDIFLFIAGKASSGTPIKVVLRKVDHTAAIDISFAGPPLSAAQREQLLEPFSAEGAGGGSLELAVAAMVFEEKGGRLLLESSESGNTITAELPLA